MTPEGMRALTSWTNLWLAGAVLEIMACVWRAVVGVPLRKGDDGMDVRPILLGEILMSLPGACLQYITQYPMAKLLKPTQFGIGIAAAPETMVGIISALTTLCPDDAFAAFDMSNAFGEISRAEIFQEIIEYLPSLAPSVLALWGPDGTPIYVANGAFSW